MGVSGISVSTGVYLDRRSFAGFRRIDETLEERGWQAQAIAADLVAKWGDIVKVYPK